MEYLVSRFDDTGAATNDIVPHDDDRTGIDLNAELTNVDDGVSPEALAAPTDRAGYRGTPLGENSRQFPFSSIGQFISYTPDRGVERGSGTIIFTRIILTAAHVIYDTNSAGHVPHQSIRFFPGAPLLTNGVNSPGFTPAEIYTPMAYLQNPGGNPALDYSAIITRESTSSYANVGLLSDALALGKVDAISVGYPHDAPYDFNARPLSPANPSLVQDAFMYRGPFGPTGNSGMMIQPGNDFSVGASGGPWLVWKDRYYLGGINKAQEDGGVKSSRVIAPEIWDFVNFVAKRRNVLFPGG